MQTKYLTSILIGLSTFCIISAQSNETDVLTPNYDNDNNDALKAIALRKPLMLSCTIKGKGALGLVWEKDGVEVSKVPDLQGRYRIIDAENKFIIDKPVKKDNGTYSCTTNQQTRIFNVVEPLSVKVPSNTAVVEGEKLQISCTVSGTNPYLTWEFGNLNITNSTGRYILKEENNVQNAILSIDNVSVEDKGEYKCVGRYVLNNTILEKTLIDTCTVRVKGKLAALWPFLGICAEVLILCTIILIYEKRRNKSELDESDTDPQEQ